MARGLIDRTPMGDKPYYVYELLYPDGFIDEDGTDLSGVIFYIGKGTFAKDAIQRVDGHEYEVFGVETEMRGRKERAIQRIWAQGLRVKKYIPLMTDDEREALIFEMEHIHKHSSSPYLTNVRRLDPVKIRRRHELLRGQDKARECAIQQKASSSTTLVHSHINAALIVDGKIRYRPIYGTPVRFVSVMIKCRGKHSDGSLCTSHIGEEVTIVENDVHCILCSS